MDFGWALNALRSGKVVRQTGDPDTRLRLDLRSSLRSPLHPGPVIMREYVRLPDYKEPWIVSQSAILATDWEEA